MRGALRDPAGTGRVVAFFERFLGLRLGGQALGGADQSPVAGAAPPRPERVRRRPVVRRFPRPPANPGVDALHGGQPGGDGPGQPARVQPPCCCRGSAFKEAQRMARALGADRTVNRRSAATGSDGCRSRSRPRRAPASASSGSCELVDPRHPRAGLGAPASCWPSCAAPHGGEHPKAKHELLRVDRRDHHRGLPDGRRGEGRSGRDARRGRRRGRPPRARRDVQRHASDDRLADAADQPQPALRQADRADAVAGAPAADLRRPRARRRPQPRQGDPDRQRADRRTCRISWRCRRPRPYWIGTDTGLASSRSKVFEGLPTAGLPVPALGLGRSSRS